MEYKIAVATSDQKYVDRSFRETPEFAIYQVEEDGMVTWLESRKFIPEEKKEVETSLSEEERGGCTGNGTGCGMALPKVELIQDCRSVVCTKPGFQVQKKLQRMAISLFDVECSVEEALKKISEYFRKTDNHQNLGKR